MKALYKSEYLPRFSVVFFLILNLRSILVYLFIVMAYRNFDDFYYQIILIKFQTINSS